MVKELKLVVGFDPENAEEVKGQLAMRIQCELLKRKPDAASLSNGVHLDLSRLVRDKKLSAKDSARLHVAMLLGRYV